MFYKNLLFFILILISGCGFAPMNRLSDGAPVSTLTEQIAIAGIPEQEGWLLKQKLQNQLNPQKKGGAKKYTLTVQLATPRFTDQSIEGDAFASRETALITAAYILTENNTNQVVIKDQTAASGAYNIVKEPYATQMARNKLKENLITIIANNIALRLTAYLKSTEEVRESETVSN